MQIAPAKPKDSLELSEGMGEVPQEPAPLEKDDSIEYSTEISPVDHAEEYSSMKTAEIPGITLSPTKPIEVPVVSPTTADTFFPSPALLLLIPLLSPLLPLLTKPLPLHHHQKSLPLSCSSE